MKINEIHYSSEFRDQFTALPLEIKKKAIKAEKLFSINPFYPSLRLHKLRGKLQHFWSISIDYKYRIIFQILDDGVVLFFTVGLHAIYDQ